MTLHWRLVPDESGMTDDQAEEIACLYCGTTDFVPWSDPENPAAVQVVCQCCGMRGPFKDNAADALAAISAHLPAPQSVEGREGFERWFAATDEGFATCGDFRCRDKDLEEKAFQAGAAWQSTALARENEALRRDAKMKALYIEAVLKSEKRLYWLLSRYGGHREKCKHPAKSCSCSWWEVEREIAALTTPAGGA
jgi:hypothetical protein